MRVFRLTEREVQPDCHEISVEGELDLAVADQLRQAITRCDAERILINLRACEFIDSTGIAVIVQAHRELADENRQVVVHSPSEQVLRILTITGLTGNSLVAESSEEATLEPG